jgi:hypothetical protein
MHGITLFLFYRCSGTILSNKTGEAFFQQSAILAQCVLKIKSKGKVHVVFFSFYLCAQEMGQRIAAIISERYH